jgi:plastocyanin
MSPRPRRRTIVRGLLAGLGALAISAPGLACGGGDDQDSSAAPSTTATGSASAPGAVEMFDFGFDPNTAMIAAGEDVTWENIGETLHNVKGKGFFSDGMEPGDTFEHEFAKAGVYDYLCTLHPDTMRGTVVVE